MNSQSQNQNENQEHEQIFAISNEVFRIKVPQRNIRGKNIKLPKNKGVAVKNQDFSYENFNLHENFQKSDLNSAVFSKITKTINLVRIFELLDLKKRFAKWVYFSHMSAARQSVLDKLNYKTIKILTFWNKEESSVKSDSIKKNVAAPFVKVNKTGVQLEKQNSKSNELVDEKVQKKERKQREEAENQAAKVEENVEHSKKVVKKESSQEENETVIKKQESSSEVKKSEDVVKEANKEKNNNRKDSENISRNEELAKVKAKIRPPRVKVEFAQNEENSEEVQVKAEEKVTEFKGEEKVTKVKAEEIVSEVKAEEKVTEVKAEEKVTEVKAEEKVTEVKVEEKVTKVKAEEKVTIVKAEEKVSEVKAEEKVSEVKAEEKVTEVKAEEKVTKVKAEEKVSEVKAEEIVSEVKAEEKVAEVKAEEKVTEVKAEEKVTEVKAEEKVTEVKVEEKVTKVKAEEKVSEVKAEEKVTEVKAEEKVTEVKAEEKVTEVKAEEKVTIVKAEEKVSEVKAEEKVTKVKAEEKVSEVKAEEPATKVDVQESEAQEAIEIEDEKPKEKLPSKSEESPAKVEQANIEQDDPALAKVENAVEAPKTEAKSEDPAKAAKAEEAVEKEQIKPEANQQKEIKTEERNQEAEAKPENPAKAVSPVDSPAKLAKQDSFVFVDKADLNAETNQESPKDGEECEDKLEIVSRQAPVDPLREKLCRKISEIKASLNQPAVNKSPSSEFKMIEGAEGDFVILNRGGESPRREFDESIHLADEDLRASAVLDHTRSASKLLNEELEYLKKLAKEKEDKIALLENAANRAETINLSVNKIENLSSKKPQELDNLKENIAEATEALKPQEQQEKVIEEEEEEEVVCADAPEEPEFLAEDGDQLCDLIVSSSAKTQKPIDNTESKNEKQVFSSVFIDMTVITDPKNIVPETIKKDEVVNNVVNNVAAVNNNTVIASNVNNYVSGTTYKSGNSYYQGSTANYTNNATFVSNTNNNSGYATSSAYSTVAATAVSGGPYSSVKYYSSASNTQVTSSQPELVSSGSNNRTSAYVSSYSSNKTENPTQYKSDITLVSSGNATIADKHTTNYLNQTADSIKNEEKTQKYLYSGNTKLNTIRESSSEYTQKADYAKSSITEVTFTKNALNDSNSKINATSRYVTGENTYYNRTPIVKEGGESQPTLVSSGNTKYATNVSSSSNNYNTSNTAHVVDLTSQASDSRTTGVSGSSYISATNNNNNNVYVSKADGISSNTNVSSSKATSGYVSRVGGISSNAYVSGSNKNYTYLSQEEEMSGRAYISKGNSTNSFFSNISEGNKDSSQFSTNIKKLMSEFDSEFSKIQNKIDKVTETRQSMANILNSSSNPAKLLAKADVSSRINADISDKNPAQYINGGKQTDKTNSSDAANRVIDLVASGNRNTNTTVVETKLNTSASNALDVSMSNAVSAQTSGKYYSPGAQSNNYTYSSSAGTVNSKYSTYATGSNYNQANTNNIYSPAEIVSSGKSNASDTSKTSSNYNYTSYSGNKNSANAVSGKYTSGTNYYSSSSSNQNYISAVSSANGVSESIELVSSGAPKKLENKLDEVSTKVDSTTNSANNYTGAKAISSYTGSNINTYTTSDAKAASNTYTSSNANRYTNAYTSSNSNATSNTYTSSNANRYTNAYTSSNNNATPNTKINSNIYETSNTNNKNTYYASNTGTRVSEAEVVSTGHSAAYYNSGLTKGSTSQGNTTYPSQSPVNKYMAGAILAGTEKYTGSNNAAQIIKSSAAAADNSNLLVSSGKSNTNSGAAVASSSLNTLSGTGIFSSGAVAQSKYLAGNSTTVTKQSENANYNSSSNYNYVTSSNYSGYSSGTAKSDLAPLVSNGAFSAQKYNGTDTYTATSAASEKSKYEEKLSETLDAIRNKKQTQPTPNTKNIEQMLANAKLTTSYFATSDSGNVGFGNTKEYLNNTSDNKILNALFKDDPKGMKNFMAVGTGTYTNLAGKQN